MARSPKPKALRVSRDPSLKQMQDYLELFFPELPESVRGQAIYWFAYRYHRAPDSNLYRVLSAFTYSPVPLAAPPEKGDPAHQPYQMLRTTYALHAREYSL